MMRIAEPTRIPDVWIRQSELQRKETDQRLISAFKRLDPSIEQVTTFGLYDTRVGVAHKGFALDRWGNVCAIADDGLASVRVPNNEEKEIMLEQEFNALSYCETLTEVIEYTMIDGVWTAS